MMNFVPENCYAMRGVYEPGSKQIKSEMSLDVHILHDCYRIDITNYVPIKFELILPGAGVLGKVNMGLKQTTCTDAQQNEYFRFQTNWKTLFNHKYQLHWIDGQTIDFKFPKLQEYKNPKLLIDQQIKISLSEKGFEAEVLQDIDFAPACLFCSYVWYRSWAKEVSPSIKHRRH